MKQKQKLQENVFLNYKPLPPQKKQLVQLLLSLKPKQLKMKFKRNLQFNKQHLKPKQAKLQQMLI